jgi:polar amino acid transport system substrate-binding protein
MFRSILTVAFLAFGVARAIAADIPLLTNYAFAPFSAEEKASLTYELAQYMTRKSGGAYTFTAQLLPRKRLDEEVASGKPVVVAWVNPAWFGDVPETKYKWSAALVQDANAVISPKAKPVEFSNPDALAGLKLGGVAGHTYVGIDPLVASGKISREDAPGEVVNLKKVAAGRVDFMLMSEAGARFLAKTESLADQIHFSANPQSRYDRKVFVAGPDAKLADFVTQTLNGLANDPEWKQITAKYL